MGGCSGAHSSPEQYTGLPATPPHRGGCLATGTYRPMAAGPGPAAPDGCTAGPHSRAIGGRFLVSRRDTHVPARAGAGRSRTPRVLSEARSSTAPSAAWRPRRSRQGARDPRQLATRRGQPPAQPRQPSLGEKEAERSWEPLLLAKASAGKSHPPRAPARGRAALRAARATPREPLWGGPTLALPTTFFSIPWLPALTQ